MAVHKKNIGNQSENIINILIHGAESSKAEWFEKDGYTKGGNFTEALEKAGLAYIACDLYGHGEWQAEEEDFDADDISDEIWPKVVSESVDYIVETLLDLSGDDSPLTTYNIISYSMGSVFALKLLEALEALKDFNDCEIGKIIFCSPVVEREYDDEYSFHNNLELFQDKDLTIFLGSQDDDEDPEDTRRAFNLVSSEKKELIEFDCGHSLPVEWVAIAIKNISDNG